LITIQAARGVPSHFNYSSTLNATVFMAMAAMVGVFTVGAIIVGLVLARRNLEGW
ncbi:MAG: hypothetical protein F6K50_37355, partial [Moorea sp. SIO3I7]|nr:hypothetical protein [Moorena sp. SIO3I7]